MEKKMENYKTLLDSAIESIDALAFNAREKVLQDAYSIAQHIEWHLDDISDDEFYTDKGVKELLEDEEQLRLFVEDVAKHFATLTAAKLYRHLDISDEMVQADLKSGWLTSNTGRDGCEYWWYMDEHKNCAIHMYNGELVSDEDEINQLFYISDEEEI